MSLSHRSSSGPKVGTQIARFVAVALVLCAMFAPSTARAWIETTVVSDDMKVFVERAGGGVVEHSILMRVRGGPLRSLSLPGVDLDATPEPEATISLLPTREGAPPETTMPMGVLLTPDGALRFDFNDGKGIGRGSYILHLRYRTDLVKSQALERDGAMVRLRWMGPKWPNGLDTAKCTFVLPTGPSEPRAASDRRDGDLDPTGDLAVSGAGAFLTTTRRLADHDEIELVRPHVARGEQVAWVVRMDPRVLSSVNDPRLLPLPSATAKAQVDESPRERQVWLAIACGIAILFTALTAIKGRQVELAARGANVVPRPLVPFSVPVRALLVGPLFAGAVALQLFVDPPAIGAFVLVLAMALMAHRTPLARATARAPGRWLAISDTDAFRAADKPLDSWLDASTSTGKIALILTALLLAGLVFATSRISPYHATMAALDGASLAALFFTGRRSELPAELALTPVSPLRRIAKSLRTSASNLRVVPWARFANGAVSHDELRLLVMPKSPMRGLSSIEIGFTYPTGAGGPIACAEILVRVAEESAAELTARSLSPLGRWVSGRRAGERVLTLEPRLPGWRSAAALALRLSAMLAEEAAPSPTSQRTKSAARASGKGERAVKAATTSSPLHVTDAACSA